MKYAKLIDGHPIYAPHMFVDGNIKIFNPTDDMYITHGYLPVIMNDIPETDDKNYAVPSWKEENGQIVQEWSIEKIPDNVTEADYIEALNNIGVDMGVV